MGHVSIRPSGNGSGEWLRRPPRPLWGGAALRAAKGNSESCPTTTGSAQRGAALRAAADSSENCPTPRPSAPGVGLKSSMPLADLVWGAFPQGATLPSGEAFRTTTAAESARTGR